MFKEALTSYREALRFLPPLLVVHLFIRLVVAAILVPIIIALLGFTLSFSDQSALTDQDIARFLLTPVGALGALVLVSFVIAAAVTDVATMTSVLRLGVRGPLSSLRAALAFLMGAMPRLVLFAGYLLVQILAIVLPFFVVAAGVAAILLREFDINYYLSNRPPEFILTVLVAGLCAVGILAVLLERLTAWAIALHYCVFDGVSAQNAFALSRQKMRGHRLELLRRVLAWAILRIVAASALTLITGVILAEFPKLFHESITYFFWVTAIILIFWTALNALLNTLANGALSDILNEEFERALEARAARFDARPSFVMSGYVVLPVLIVVFSLGSLTFGGFLSNQVGGVANVEVIGHRGAAASRPENTMAAVEKAVADGADWVEIDVQETADGQVLVVHDSDFMKAAGVPLKIWDATMDDVAKIDIGSWFDQAYAEERAPLLRDVLLTVKDRAKLIIELKYYGHDVDLENRVIALVEDAQMQDQIATMSLKYPAVQKMLTLRPEWRTGVLAATAVGNLSGLDGDFLAVSSGKVSARLLAQAAIAGKDVYAWTVNDAATMSRMISLGVDGLITDEPALANDIIAYYDSLSTPERLILRLGDTIGFTFDFTPDSEDI